MQRFFSLYIIMRLKEKMEKPLLERYKSTRDLNESPIVRTNSVSSTTDETPLQTNNESVFCVNDTYITQKTTYNTLFYDPINHTKHTSCSLENRNSLMFPSSLTTVHIHISSPTSSPTPSPIHSLTSSPKHAAALPTTIPVPVHVPVPVPVPVPTSKSRSSCLIA